MSMLVGAGDVQEGGRHVMMMVWYQKHVEIDHVVIEHGVKPLEKSSTQKQWSDSCGRFVRFNVT